MVPLGIRFNDCLFTEPMRLAEWKVPQYAGLFVILAKDSNWAPKAYQPLYFGEFGNNTLEVFLPGNRGLLTGSDGDMAFFISVLPMPFSTTAQRWALRNELLWAYHTVWQAKELQTAGGHANQLAEVDRKPYPEQSAQVLPLVAGVNDFLQPQPERQPRRRIGFV